MAIFPELEQLRGTVRVVMSDDEFMTLAEEIIERLRPCFDAGWADMVGSAAGAGEFLIAVDDALQCAALAGFAVDAELVVDVERVIEDCPPTSHDRVRLARWLGQLPRTSSM